MKKNERLLYEFVRYNNHTSGAENLLRYGVYIVNKIKSKANDSKEDAYNSGVSPVDANIRDINGNTPIFYARTPGMIKLLIKYGADVNAVNKFGETPLCYTTKLQYAELLIDAGADIQMKTNAGISVCEYMGKLSHRKLSSAEELLFKYVKDDKVRAVQELMKLGVDANVRDKKGDTPLFFVRSAAMTELLLERGADVNAIGLNNDTPIFTAGRYGGDRAGIIKLLISAGAKVNFMNASGENPLFTAKSLEVVNMLIEAGARTDIRNNEAKSLLFFSEDIEIMKRYLEAGVDVNARESFTGYRMLHLAESAEEAQMLIDNGAEVNVKNMFGDTPLYKSIRRHLPEVVSVLLKA
ncbi:MAG: ankyrin repeat domain-containing protein, partial [candidate division WOR-3 bacterium]|nr:ankyrin repeat domain-containing protein [candidate division WOR-3 bacterium]